MHRNRLVGAKMLEVDAVTWLKTGEDSLKHGDWAAARAAFQEAVALEPGAEAFEGLGTACWWQDDQNAVLEAREAAFRSYRERGDRRSAARIATALAIDYADYRSDLAVCAGWLQRAERLLQGIKDSPEHGWLHLYQGLFSLMYMNDLPQAHRNLEEAKSLAPRLGDLDIEMMTVELEGLVMVREGKVAQGMLRLDEAMTAAVGGEMTDLAAIGMTCCSLIYACEAVADYDRAAQWCERAREFCRRMGLEVFFTICRNYYATVLIWRGAWQEADAELSAAMREFRPERAGGITESLAKLGELRRRQGRLDEAKELFERAQPHRLALTGQAAIALESGDGDSALDLLQRVLRRVGDEDQAERVFVLELLVRAQSSLQDFESAGRSLSQLEAAASRVGTQPLRATANAAGGILAQARGNLDAAKLQYQDAIDLYDSSGAYFDSARTRLDYAATLRALGRMPAAAEQAMLAQASFNRLGAALYAQRAADFVSQFSRQMGSPPSGALPHGLTRREAEVLWRIAAGRTNQDIAAELVLSIRTVERHISTIYEKLNLQGRAARASAAAFAISLRAANT
jgi:DNA-binding CsgD family transcriptional regulator